MSPKVLMPEIGATDELSLRVSVGALVRVLFEYPKAGEWMLALERKATLLEGKTGPVVIVKSQPFGGALRIHKLEPLHDLMGSFRFDSEESRAEQDFRIFIRPSDWDALRDFCLKELNPSNDPVLEADPTRELAEEFDDALKINLKPDQYTLRAVGTIVEDHPSTTEYIYARGYPTVRIYRIFEARILDASLATAVVASSETCSDQQLRALALQDPREGALGRANAVLTVPFKEVNDFYLAIPLEARNAPISFKNHKLDETVAAVLDRVTVPKYRRIP